MNGDYPPGTQIHSENELSGEMGVSRVTVREALRDLVRENLLVKVQGKGTFVAQSISPAMPRMKLTGFLEDLYDQIQKVGVRTAEIDRTPVTDDLRKVLGLGQEVSELVRIRSAAGRAACSGRLAWRGEVQAVKAYRANDGSPLHQAFTLASTPRMPDGLTISTKIINTKA
jgi:DNA-binding GntR family transcriptional regulator